MIKAVIAAAAFLALATSTAFAADPSLAKQEDKLSYSLGVLIGQSLQKDYATLNYDLLLKGIREQHSGEKPLLSLQEAQQVLQQYTKSLTDNAAAIAREKGRKYLAENILREGVITTDSGLQYEILKNATGPQPKGSDSVQVHYTGTLINGTVFDSSVERGEPTSFPLNRVIPGWIEGLQLMSVGSKYRFVIPADLAYGDNGAGENIGPGETLIFTVELLAINPGQ